MTDRSNRLFEIIQILRSTNGPVPAHALASSLEVTKRTIYRDIVALQATGVPIEGAAGIGYVMRAGYNLPPLMFTADEIEAIVVGLSLLDRTGDAGLQTSAARVSQKIADVLPDSSQSPFEAAPLLVSHWNTVPPPGADNRLMRKAIREEENCSFTTRTPKREPRKERSVQSGSFITSTTCCLLHRVNFDGVAVCLKPTNGRYFRHSR